ncbi:MAG: D-2-hydroxyacid dehydrogenase [Treponema sp.]|nr:D-2-hydroxyacid dehydrogenase [Treponema sp.]
MKLVILDGNALNPGDLSWDGIKKIAQITVYPRTNPEELIERIGDAEAILVNKVKIQKDVFRKCPKLKYIGVTATGYNVIDVEAAKQAGVIVTNIPAYSTDSVAQHVFAFILNFTNSVYIHNESVQNGQWITCPDFCYWKNPLTELTGKTLGIFGYGSIGSKVAQIGKAFGMNVICCTRTPKENMPKSVSFEELLQQSDFLSLHAPLTEKTQNIINKDSLKLMKKSAYLINTARGGFINEKDLAECLSSNGIAGYAADVVLEEPMNKENPLLGAKNCVITPHIAWAPLETRQRLLNIVEENLKAFLNGNPQNVVNK